MGFVNTFLLVIALINFYNNITFTCSKKLDKHEESRSFIGFGTHTSTQRTCICSTSSFCSCCEIVKFLYSLKPKKLCFNMIYEANVLNVDLSLDALILKSMTAASSRPFKMCADIPGVLFSTACVTVTDVNKVTSGNRSSVTVCPRLEVSTKKENWNITYKCNVLMPNGTAGMGMVVVMMPGAPMTPMMVPGVPMVSMVPGAPMMPMTGGVARPPGAPMAMTPGAPMPMTPGAPMAMTPGAPMPMTPGAPMPMTPGAPMPMMPATPPMAMRPGGAAAPGAPPMGAPPAAGPMPAMGPPPGAPAAPAMGPMPSAPLTAGARPPAPPVPAASTIVPRITGAAGSPMLVVMMNQRFASALESIMTEASASMAMAKENHELAPEMRFDSAITMLESQTSLPNADEQPLLIVSNGNDHTVDLRSGRESHEQNSKVESTLETEQNFKNLKRKKRNYDLFDVLHQSNKCERAYRICITRSKQYIISRLRNVKQNAQVKNGCVGRLVRIVHEPVGNLCTQSNEEDNTTPVPVQTEPPLEFQDSIIHTDDDLSAIVIQDEYSDGSDYQPQNNQYPYPLMTYTKAEMYPSRIPPIALHEEISRSSNDSIILQKN